MVPSQWILVEFTFSHYYVEPLQTEDLGQYRSEKFHFSLKKYAICFLRHNKKSIFPKLDFI